jgi:hypothetical protein
LLLDVDVKPGIVVTPQALLDQGTENDLKAHGEFERGRRLSGQDPGPIQDVLGKDEKNSRLVREHRTSPWTAVRPDAASANISVSLVIYFAISYISGSPDERPWALISGGRAPSLYFIYRL